MEKRRGCTACIWNKSNLKICCKLVTVLTLPTEYFIMDDFAVSLEVSFNGRKVQKWVQVLEPKIKIMIKAT